MAIDTVLVVAVDVTATLGFAHWASRPGSYREGPRARRVMGILTAVWVIYLPVSGAVALGFGADALGAGERGAWQNLVIGAVAIACWPVVLLALRGRRPRHQALRP
jgi:hypothetical protein